MAWDMSTGAIAEISPFPVKSSRASPSLSLSFFTKLFLSITGALQDLFLHTKTIDDAKAFVPFPISLVPLSVLRGQVPEMAKPAAITADRKVSQPVLVVAPFFVPYCLNA